MANKSVNKLKKSFEQIHDEWIKLQLLSPKKRHDAVRNIAYAIYDNYNKDELTANEIQTILKFLRRQFHTSVLKLTARIMCKLE